MEWLRQTRRALLGRRDLDLGELWLLEETQRAYCLTPSNRSTRSIRFCPEAAGLVWPSSVTGFKITPSMRFWRRWVSKAISCWMVIGATTPVSATAKSRTTLLGTSCRLHDTAAS